jgi:hypothetical protein
VSVRCLSKKQAGENDLKFMTQLQRTVEDYRKVLERPVRCVEDMVKEIEIPCVNAQGTLRVDNQPS